jgi:alcohol dehydrogenase class IV
MDALTHAAEAYIGYHDIPFVKKMSEEATRLIFESLTAVFEDGSLITERGNMLRASYCGGAAFTGWQWREGLEPERILIETWPLDSSKRLKT